MTGLRVAVVAEDSNLRDLAVALAGAVARAQGQRIEVDGRWLTRGCRDAELAKQYRAAATHADVVVVVADAADASRGRRRRPSHRQKARGLERRLPRDVEVRHHVGAADPCAEGWLLALGPAVVSGLSGALGITFHGPAQWPSPRSEREAKEALAGLIANGTGGQRLTRDGFEFCSEIVAAAELGPSLEPSLAEFVQGLRRLLAV